MRIVCISDTHGMHDEIRRMPQGDFLIHAGDLTNEGIPKEIFDAYAWLSRQPYERIVITPGNHDAAYQRIPQLVGVLKSKFPRVETLIDQETMIGPYRMYASPWQPFFNDWSFNFAPGPPGEQQAEQKWDMIPDDTAILMTHGPVYGILDQTLRKVHVGCPALRRRISQLPNLKLYVCGHIHESYGTHTVDGVLHVNACTCDSQYWPTQPPIVVDLDEHGARHVPFSEWAT